MVVTMSHVTGWMLPDGERGAMTLAVGDTRPYPPTGMTRYHWRAIPPSWVEWAQLTTTQAGVWIDALLNPRTPHSGDPHPHVVAWGGKLYLEDGHTRVVRALLTGTSGGYVRIHQA